MLPRNSILLSLALFGFWLLVSAKLDVLHLSMGAISAGAVALATRPLLALPPAIGPGVSAPVTARLVVRFGLYLPWLFWQIVVASLQVTRVILDPRMPVEPRLIRLRTDLTSPFARLVLANSITLTPGTVTLDVEGDELLVHTLTGATARGLSGEGGMAARIGRLFGPDERTAR